MRLLLSSVASGAAELTVETSATAATGEGANGTAATGEGVCVVELSAI
jgi:hypothetical protein